MSRTVKYISMQICNDCGRNDGYRKKDICCSFCGSKNKFAQGVRHVWIGVNRVWWKPWTWFAKGSWVVSCCDKE